MCRRRLARCMKSLGWARRHSENTYLTIGDGATRTAISKGGDPMSEKRDDDEAPKSEDRRDSDDEEDIASRFPDFQRDTRLDAHIDLPEPPKVTFTRPDTQVAREAMPTPEEAANQSVRVGRVAGMSGGDIRNAGAAAMIGWSLAISIFVGAGLGYLVDRFLLGSPATPWGVIGGFLLGVIAGFVNMLRIANQLNQDK
jgi:F0F1-type ATP synthase assembly protein I